MRAKSLQSCLTLCDPMDCSPPGSSVHGDSPGKNTGVGCHFLLRAIFPNPGIEPASLVSAALAGRFFTTSAAWEAQGPQSTADVTILSLNLNLPTQSLQLWGAPTGSSSWYVGRPLLSEVQQAEVPATPPTPSTAWAHSSGGALTFDIHRLFLREGSPNCRSFTKHRSAPRSTNSLVTGYYSTSPHQKPLCAGYPARPQAMRVSTLPGAQWALHSGARCRPLGARCQQDALF